MPLLHMTRVAVGCADYPALQARIANYAQGSEIRFTTRFKPKRADELIGVSAYMRLAALNGLMRESAVISGAYLAVDPYGASALYRKLKATPAIATTATIMISGQSSRLT